MHSNSIRRNLGLILVLTATMIVSAVAIMQAQTNKPLLSLTATSANVGGAGEAIRINVLRWSTDAERDAMLAAWAPPAVPAGGGAPGGGAPGAGGARGGAGGAGAPAAGAPAAGAAAAGAAAPPAAGAAAGAPAAGAAAAGAAGARGGAAQGGRGGAGAVAVVRTPEAGLLAALQAGPTVGYLWTSESVGYSLRYAYRIATPDGGERIILATDRRLGSSNPQLWKPAGTATPTDYQFSVIELRLNNQGQGQGKASVTTKVTLDTEAKTIALEGYAAAPVLFQGVKH